MGSLKEKTKQGLVRSVVFSYKHNQEKFMITFFFITILDLYSHLAVFILEFQTNSFPGTYLLKVVTKQFLLVSNKILQQFFHCHDIDKMTI